MVRRVREAEGARWDDFISSSPDATYAHSWGWMDLYRKYVGASPLALVLESGERIAGAFGGVVVPLHAEGFRRVFLLGKAFWSPHELTWDYGGPCFAERMSESDSNAIIKAMEVAARREGVWQMRISPFAPRIASALRKSGYEPRERLTSIVSLDLPEDQLWKNLDQTFRTDIRKAQRAGLVFETGRGASILPEFMECIGPLASERGFQLPPRGFLEDVLSLDSRATRSHWHAVRDTGGNAVAIGISLSHVDGMNPRWWVATPDGKRDRANHLLVWGSLLWAQENGFRYYDLGGIPSDPTHGIFKFKRKIGGQIRRVDWYVKYLGIGRLRALRRQLAGSRVVAGSNRPEAEAREGLVP